MHILIPAFEPDHRLVELVLQLQQQWQEAHASTPSIIVVDDGSSVSYAEIFRTIEKLGCVLLRHPRNLGKGQALKTGFSYLLQSGTDAPVVCADSDGQHLPEDIMRIAACVKQHPHSIVIGGRRFTGKVPLRSSLGNRLTRLIFTHSTGIKLHDTQTGLRGYPASMLAWLLEVPGDRFEYEMKVLLQASKAGYELLELPIETVYLEHNASSHFRPFADSLRVILPFAAFSGVSLLCGAIDFALVLLLYRFGGSLLLAVCGARAASSILNYLLNRTLVFGYRQEIQPGHSFARYALLAASLLLLNYLLLSLLYRWIGMPLPVAKIVTELSLFLVSYYAQKTFVFAKHL